MLVSGVQQSDSVIYICVCVYTYIYTLFKILFHYKLLQDIEYSSLVPCAIQLVPVVYFIYSNVSIVISNF